ncbi:hypothetical protein GmHk_17G050062 [Glycine max]|nr:hypothetical protein GmHk_17G050062 [Glycine max]
MAKRKVDELDITRSKGIESSSNMDLREDTCKQIARFFYINAIPLKLVESEEFQKMCNHIGGPGFKPPTYDELRGKYLKQEVAEIMESIEEHKATWKKTGCCILIDDWTNSEGVTICNFFLNSSKGTVFLKYVYASDMCKTVDGIFKMIDDIVEEVGEENVVQMLEDFVNKLQIYGDTVANGRRIASYMYSRSSLIALLHHFAKGKDLVKPGVTKFATCYLTLKGGKVAKSIVMGDKFWKSIMVCLKGANPLIKLLHLVSSDTKPAIGFIYEEMKQAKVKIQRAFKSVKKRYMPLWDNIDERWDRKILRPLHAAAYYLNPQFHYNPNFKEDFEVKHGLHESIYKMVTKQDWPKVDPILEDFKHARNYFGNELAKVHMKRRNRMRQQTWNDVLLVMSNSKLAKRHQAGKAIEYSIDDLSSDDEWITENDESSSSNEESELDDIDYREYESSSNNEESELDGIVFYVPNEDDKLKGQVGEDVNNDSADVDDLQTPDDDIEFDDEADVDDEDDASNATDDIMDGDGSYMEDDSCDDFDINELLH